MKRKKVMRLLAVAMAASVAVTSQGIPAGLTTVYADVTAKDDLTDGYYVELTDYIKHTAACYDGYNSDSSSSTIFTVGENDKYFVKNSTTGTLTSDYTKIDKDKIIKKGTDDPLDLTGRYIETEGSGETATHTVYEIATEKTIVDEKIKQDKAAANKTTVAGVGYLNLITFSSTEEQTSLNSRVGENSTTGKGETGKIVFDGNSSYASDAGSVKTDGTVYKVTKYVLHSHQDSETGDSDDSTLKGLPGVIYIESLTGDGDVDLTEAYKGILGSDVASNIKVGDIYVPVVVEEYTPSFDLNAEVTIEGQTSTTYTLVSKTYGDENNENVWVDKNSPVTVDTTYYVWSADENNSKGNFVIHTATVVTDSDLDSRRADDSGDTYDISAATGDPYTSVLAAIKAQDGNDAEILSGSLGDNTNVVKGSDGTYYLDVTKYFIKSIALTNPTESKTRYISDTTGEADVDDGLTLTYASNTSGTPETATLLDSEVTNSYVSGTETGSATITGFKYDTGAKEFYYVMENSTANGIIETGEVKKLSELTNIKNSGLAGTDTDIEIPLTAVTAPDIAKATASGTTYTPSGAAAHDAYDVTADNSKVSVAAPTIETSGATEGTWTYKWVDEVTVGENSATKETTADAAATLGAYETKTPGLHKVYVEAYFGTSTTPTATSEANAVEFYVVESDNTAVIADPDPIYEGTTLSVTASSTKNAGASISYKYYAAIDTTKQSAISAPTAAGSYIAEATFEENLALGLKKTVVDKVVTIKEKEKATADAGTTTFAKAAEEAAHEIKLDALDAYKTDGGELSGTLTSDKTADIASATFTGNTNTVSFTLESNATADDVVTLSGTLSNSKYKVDVTVKVKIVAQNVTVKDLSLKPITLIYLDEYGSDALLDGVTGYTVTYGDTEDTATAEFPTKVGTTNMYVTYSYDNTVGSGSTTLTINKKAIKITEKPQTIKQNGSVSTDAANYTIAKNDEGDEVNTLPSGLGLTAKIYDKTGTEVTGTLTVGGEYTYKYVLTGSEAANYTLAESTGATLTVEAAPYTPASGTDTDKTPSDTTTEPTIKENEDGDKVIVDADGKVIADELVTIDGKSYVTDENGEVLTSQIAEVGDVKVYVGKNGVVATDKAVTYEGKKYYATETGEIATNSFVTTARGNKVYATKTGELKTSTTFTVKGKKYYAKASGVIATTGFVKTAKGNTVYATKSGALQVNKAFKASNGKKYVADKNGKIVKGKKITIGKKTYTTNKKGVIVKVTTKKK